MIYPKTLKVLQELIKMDDGQKPSLWSDAKDALRELVGVQQPKSKSEDFTEFVWYKGKVWFNPHNPVTHRGEISLWSVKNDGLGVQAKLHEVRDCTCEEMDAIKYFQGSKRNPELTRIGQALEKEIEYWQHVQNDPYNIANAVLTTLKCVQNAIETANKY